MNSETNVIYTQSWEELDNKYFKEPKKVKVTGRIKKKQINAQTVQLFSV